MLSLCIFTYYSVVWSITGTRQSCAVQGQDAGSGSLILTTKQPSFRQITGKFSLQDVLSNLYSDRSYLAAMKTVNYCTPQSELDLVERDCGLRFTQVQVYFEHAIQDVLHLKQIETRKDCPYILTLSGMIDIESSTPSLVLSADAIILQDVTFVFDKKVDIYVKRTRGCGSRSFLYMQNVKAGVLHVENINSIWIDGFDNRFNYFYITSNKDYQLNRDNFCALNINKNASLVIYNESEMTNYNCLNIQGSLEVREELYSNSFTEHSEVYFGADSESQFGKLTITSGRKAEVMTYGKLWALNG
jgi:hypothetical protein